MKSKSLYGGLAPVTLVASLGAASAFGGNFLGMDPDSRNDVVNAIQAKDYNAWKEAMSAQLTEENFNKLVERHEAMSSRQALREQMKQAIQERDYEAWKEAAEKSSLKSYKILNESDFQLLVQLYQAKEEGDYAKVRELSEQLGMPGGSGKHKMFGHFGRGRMI